MLGPAMHTARSWSMGCLALLAVAVGCGGGEPPAPGVPVRVLTWNLYLGTDFVALATVPTPAAIPPVAAELWADVQASDFPARARVVAARIAALAPDVVALQEVSLYRKQAPSDLMPGSAPNATEVALDFLDLVLKELTALGAKYRVAVEAPNADVELPTSDGAGGVFDLRFTDRDAILVTDRLAVEAGVQQPFVAKVNFLVGGTGGVPLAITRSLSHVSATIDDGAPFTIANSHLEVGALSAVQTAQASELLAFMSAAAVRGPAVLLGDFNSAPGAPTYQQLTKTFADLAAKLPPPATDPTCCQSGDLTNATSTADERIDLVLTRGNFSMKSLSPVGTDPLADRTPSGRWASDHFGVVSDLELR
jgi:endonuclease/exonuclease/phosphatase family metal-dependent hydrolase